MSARYPWQIIQYRGHTFVAGTTSTMPFGIYIFTDDTEAAHALAFERTTDVSQFMFEKLIPVSDIERWTEHRASGLYYEQRVCIIMDKDSTYAVSAHIGGLPGLEQREWNLWVGEVPKEHVTDVRFEDVDLDPHDLFGG